MSKLKVNADGYKQHTLLRLLQKGDLFMKGTTLYRKDGEIQNTSTIMVTNLLTSKPTLLEANDLVSKVKLLGFDVEYVRE